ncbi:MAG: DNA polymerase Y family protein [Gammaproteobacteria bacterium]|nr:DNA polymerase Y family protein [Gammaproteobacteria bacterium]NNF48321.1 DNA polymerase Y family protein [Woeseiaceae bacterium]MBT8094978.1 DNA polymerase Y family protein [Gammaproteobacteria bacterium]MBT8104648.1 DNA polymerase Y family protein [Gammaproteobacteria bacterium]NNK24662.1 DNA polymerase Y family protein [Woeseiaceae bacterium]
MKRRACRPPALGRDAAPTPAAVQQDLPLETADRTRLSTGPAPVAVSAERLWFCAWLPKLPLEAVQGGVTPAAVVEEQHGVHRILLADAAATAAGVMPGQAANAARALLPDLQFEERSPLHEQQALEGLASWLERFSSFVAITGHDVLLLEIAGSLRLFGGLRELRQNIVRDLSGLGFTVSPAIAPTPLAATWLARSGRRACIRDISNLAPAIRRLPLACLGWPPGVCSALAGMGVATVGDCLRLPREGFTRRFGARCLLDLDRALGHLPDPRNAWRAPECFGADYEMTEEQSDRELLLNICQELLQAHERFLLARQLGAQRLCFVFFHLDGPATELRLGCARPQRSAGRWFELLGIRFDKLALPGPVIAVRLQGGMAQPLQAGSGELIFHGRPGAMPQRFSITQLAERLVARIGDQSVQSTSMVAEHRPQYAWRSHSVLADWSSSTRDEAPPYLQRPLWMLPEPAPLTMHDGHPVHQGRRLQLLDGPERLETGWWDEDGIVRDYYTARNRDGRRLWVFRNRRRASSWYLHGYFG